LWGLAVQTIAGFFGAHAAASAAHEHRFGFIGTTSRGWSGALSGAFLQEAAVTLVTGSGSLNSSTTAEIAARAGGYPLHVPLANASQLATETGWA
jgi:hypothetical protein